MVTILFISDSSVLNPILHSQGLPYLNYITDKGFKSYMFSREDLFQNQKQKEEIKSIKERFSKINYIHSYGKPYTRGGWIFNLFNDIKVINKILFSEKVDIIHCRSLIPGMLGLYFKLKTFGRIKLIYDNRGLIVQEEIEEKRWKNKSIKVRFFEFIETKLLKYSDFIVVVSKQFKSYILNEYPELSLEKKIKIIPNRTKLILDSTSAAIRRINNPPVCVYSGSSARWQSLREFEKVINAALNVFKDIKFLILSYHIEEIENKLSQKNILDDNVVLKKVSQEKVFDQLSNCNFGLLIRENNPINKVSSPLKFAEYLSAGLPVLISEGIGDTENLVKQNKVGAIIKNNDYTMAIKEMKILLEDPGIYERCRKLAAKEFDLNTSFEEYLTIYRNLTEK